MFSFVEFSLLLSNFFGRLSEILFVSLMYNLAYTKRAYFLDQASILINVIDWEHNENLSTSLFLLIILDVPWSQELLARHIRSVNTKLDLTH